MLISYDYAEFIVGENCEEFEDNEENGRRVVACWNAMEGIRDPEQFVTASKEMLLQLKKELLWLEHITPQVTAVPSVLIGFDQAKTSLRRTIVLAEAAFGGVK